MKKLIVLAVAFIVLASNAPACGSEEKCPVTA